MGFIINSFYDLFKNISQKHVTIYYMKFVICIITILVVFILLGIYSYTTILRESELNNRKKFQDKYTDTKGEISLIEGFTDNEFIEEQEDYYKERGMGAGKLFAGMESADAFVKYDPVTGKLVRTTPTDIDDAATSPQPVLDDVDMNVAKCKKITSCDELDGTNCGYCFYDDRFLYGDERGPYTDVCPNGWVKTKEECQKRRDRSVCDKVSSCHEMVGAASECGWCPTNNKAYAAKTVNGKLVVKYPDTDKCGDIDIVSGADLGLVSQSDCAAFDKDHPCIGPAENTGPHSIECLQKLWKEAGGTVKGTAAPTSKNMTSSSFWNTRGWKAVFDDMKLWVSDADSTNWDLVKTHYKGVYGTNPDPCDPKYTSTPLECYQKQFISGGCTEKGSGYPKSTKPSMSKSSFINFIKSLVTNSHDEKLAYAERNSAYNKCYGGNLAAPPPIKVGDEVKYTFTSPWGPNTTIQGYVCSINPRYKTARMFWEMVMSEDGKTHVTRSAHLNSPAVLNMWLGQMCGDVPEGLRGHIAADIKLSDLVLLSSCKENTSCPDSGCNLQNIVYVSYESGSYSIAKSQIAGVMSQVRSVFPSARICDKTDIQFLVDNGVPHCACGWMKDGNIITSGYPSIKGTSTGCGDDRVEVISCGENGPSWANGKAGLYVLIDANPTIIQEKLKPIKMLASIIATMGKTEYSAFGI
jgi:hypothetical protein